MKAAAFYVTIRLTLNALGILSLLVWFFYFYFGVKYLSYIKNITTIAIWLEVYK
jgi:hypothetical protein